MRLEDEQQQKRRLQRFIFICISIRHGFLSLYLPIDHIFNQQFTLIKVHEK